VKTVTQPNPKLLCFPVLKKIVVSTINVEHTASTSSPYTHANIVHVRARMVRKQPYDHMGGSRLCSRRARSDFVLRPLHRAQGGT